MAPSQVVDVKDLPPEVQHGAVQPAAATSSAKASSTPLPTPAAAAAAGAPNGDDWLLGLEHAARGLLDAQQPGVWDALSRQMEARLITTALSLTRGRRIEAAQRLGIGRNTITRKIQELGLDDE
jgi:two-component system, NtrC family, nitrogen regulation response regulator GlnG